MVNKEEINFLKSWKLKIGILFAIVSPTITGTAAYYNLKLGIEEKQNAAETKVKDLEIRIEKNYGSKDTMQEISRDVNQIKEDVAVIKALLKKNR